MKLSPTSVPMIAPIAPKYGISIMFIHKLSMEPYIVIRVDLFIIPAGR